MQIAGSLAISTCLEIVSLRTGITANILWAPTNPIRAIALIATVGPWLALDGGAFYRRRRRDDPPLPQITQQLRSGVTEEACLLAMARDCARWAPRAVSPCSRCCGTVNRRLFTTFQ